MNSYESQVDYQERQQQQQREDHEQLRNERKARGELRNVHLELGREQARSDSARSLEAALPVPPAGENASDEEYEAERKAGREADYGAMTAEARSQYEGGDNAFEQDWPDIREKPVIGSLEKGLRIIRGGL